jgi:signal transduction histidine kinase
MIANGSFIPREVEFAPRHTIRQMLDIFETLLTTQDVKIEEFYDPLLPSYFLGDVERIQQVLLNLLSNARKFVSRKNGIIRIETSLFDIGEKYLKICIANNGPCIEPERLDSLFKPFNKPAEN